MKKPSESIFKLNFRLFHGQNDDEKEKLVRTKVKLNHTFPEVIASKGFTKIDNLIRFQKDPKIRKVMKYGILFLAVFTRLTLDHYLIKYIKQRLGERHPKRKKLPDAPDFP